MKQETIDNMIAAIQATPPDELYKQLFGFYEKDYIEYVEDKHYEFEAQYVVDAMTKLGVTEINVYDGEIQPPSKMFFHYLHNNAETGTDDEFWNGFGASTIDVPDFPLRYLWVNGQGTEHFFQLVNE